MCAVTRYTNVVIVSFRHKGLQELYETGSHKGVQPAHVTKLRLILSVLDLANSPTDVLRVPQFHAHQLQGDLAGHWSLKVNGNWRITFRFTTDGNVELTDYQDYH